jgi:hypothetical protein
MRGSPLGRCVGGTGVAAAAGKGFYPKAARVEAPDGSGLVNENTHSRPDLSGGERLRLLACQGEFSRNSFQRKRDDIADC